MSHYKQYSIIPVMALHQMSPAQASPIPMLFIPVWNGRQNHPAPRRKQSREHGTRKGLPQAQTTAIG